MRRLLSKFRKLVERSPDGFEFGFLQRLREAGL
jgi:hypothetical protein